MTQRQTALTLLLPGLAPPMMAPDLPSGKEEAGIRPVALQRLLSRATFEKFPVTGLERQLFHLFGFPLRDGELPVAELTYAFDGGERPGSRLRCDPVHLVPGHNSLVLSAGGALNLSLDECACLAAELERAYSDLDWHFEALTPERWYLTLPEAPRLRTHPLSDVVGRSIEHYLPKGQDAKKWHARIAEVQMLLHDSPVNREREMRGAPKINSLWFWGEGVLPESQKPGWQGVWSDEPVARALAESSGVPCFPVPGDAAEWLAADVSGEHLLVLDRERYLHRFQERAVWLEWLSNLEERWFSPLLGALQRGRLARLTMIGEGDRAFRLDRRAMRRWWRRRRPVEQLLGV